MAEATVQPEEPETEMSALFSVVVPTKKQPDAPSTFFSMLTKPAVDAPSAQQPSLAHMHIAVRGDLAAAEQRVRAAFGPDVESPDDIILRKQEGRVATGGDAPAEPKVVREVRVERQIQEKPIQSEVPSVPSQPSESQRKAHDTKHRHQRIPTKKAEPGPSKRSDPKPHAKDKAAAGGAMKTTSSDTKTPPTKSSAPKRGPKAAPASSKAKTGSDRKARPSEP